MTSAENVFQDKNGSHKDPATIPMEKNKPIFKDYNEPWGISKYKVKHGVHCSHYYFFLLVYCFFVA